MHTQLSLWTSAVGGARAALSLIYFYCNRGLTNFSWKTCCASKSWSPLFPKEDLLMLNLTVPRGRPSWSIAAFRRCWPQCHMLRVKPRPIECHRTCARTRTHLTKPSLYPDCAVGGIALLPWANSSGSLCLSLLHPSHIRPMPGFSYPQLDATNTRKIIVTEWVWDVVSTSF